MELSVHSKRDLSDMGRFGFIVTFIKSDNSNLSDNLCQILWIIRKVAQLRSLITCSSPPPFSNIELGGRGSEGPKGICLPRSFRKHHENTEVYLCPSFFGQDCKFLSNEERKQLRKR